MAVLALALTAGPAAAREYRTELGAQPFVYAIEWATPRQAHVTARLPIPAPPARVWAVLTDYDHLATFIPNMTRSQTVRREGATRWVAQEGLVRVLFVPVRARVTFRIEEESQTVVRFEAVEGDFTVNRGAWRVTPVAGGSQLDYEARVEPAFRVPRWVMAAMEQSLLRTMFRAILDQCVASSYHVQRRLELGALPAGRLSEAHGIGLDRAGHLLVTDPTGDHVYRYSAHGDFLGEVGSGPGQGRGQFDGPRDVKVDALGRIYVVDGSRHQLMRFDPDGRILVHEGEPGSDAALQRPHALDLASSGEVFVADTDCGRIAVFDADCRFLRAWPIPAGPKHPAAPHGVGVDPAGNVFVVDYNGPCFKYTPDGRLLAAFADTGATYHALAVDRQGQVYLTARRGPRAGEYLAYYANDGTALGMIDIPRPSAHPVCLAIDSASVLYVTDDRGIDILASAA